MLVEKYVGVLNRFVFIKIKKKIIFFLKVWLGMIVVVDYVW